MYLGNSNGDDPFVQGIIENNLIENTIGYNIEIKYQNPYPNVPGLPVGATTTIVREPAGTVAAPENGLGIRPAFVTWPVEGSILVTVSSAFPEDALPPSR